MTTPAAGWYPDPAGSGGQRWWDGATWGDQVQPAAQQVAAPGQPWTPGQPETQQWDAGAPQQQQWGTFAAHQPQQQWPGGAQQAPAGFAKRNVNSLVAVGTSALLVALLAFAHVVVLAVLPVIFAVQAVKAKEPLSWPAAGITAAVLIFAAINFF